MTTYKLDDICQQGGFLNAFVFHISGYNWAATNSAELKALFDAGDAQADSLRDAIFSNQENDVQLLQILDTNMGSQAVSYNENKGLNVGGWSVNLFSNPSGYRFGNGVSVNAIGVMGLNWQPNRTTQGFAYSVLGADLDCDTTTGIGSIEWPKDRDFGTTLYDWIDDNYDGEAFTTDLVVWVGSACLKITSFPVTSGNNWKCNVLAQVWNAPNEFIPQRIDSQNIYITNFPQSIQGQTASLWGYNIDNDGSLNTTTDGYLLRHGKCKPNSRIDTSGTWNISVGGSTDSLKFKLKRNSFRGHLSGYLFRADDYNGYSTFGELGYNVWHRPHVSMVRFTFNSSNQLTAQDHYEGDLNSGGEFFTQDLNQVKSYLVDVLNSIAPVGVDFTLSNGDIIYEDSNESGGTKYYYLVNGPSVKVTGVGYVTRADLYDYLNECTSRNPLYLEPLKRTNNQSAIFWFKNGDVAVSLRRTDENVIDDMNDRPYYNQAGGITNGNIEKHEFSKARGWCSYYYPFPMGRPTLNDLKAPEKSLYDQTNKNEPLTTTNNTFSYISSNESTLVAGDVIQFGTSGLDNEIFCEVDETDLTSSEFKSNTALITGMGYGFVWNRGIQEALTADKAYINTVNTQLATSIQIGVGAVVDDHLGKTASDFYSEKQIKDTFELIGKTSVEGAEPVDIIKALVGDPSTALTIPDSIKQTSIGYLFDRGTAFGINKGFIDFDQLQNVIDNAQYTGVTYTFPFFDSDTESLDLVALMQGLVNTHGGKMTYSWNEADRCFKIGFIVGLNTSIPNAVNSGRDFDNSYIARNATPAIDGGDWSYNIVSAKYKNRDGGTTNLNVRLEDSRIQHTLQDKVFTIKDPFTVLNTSVDDFDNQIMDRMSSLLQTLSTVQYTQTIPFKIKPFARLSLGVGHLINWEGLLDRETGKFGQEVFGDVKKVTYNLSNFTIDASVSTRTIKALGYAPSMAATISGTPGTSSLTVTVNTATNSQEFQDPDNGLTDAGYFDCYDYVSATEQVVSRDCNCGEYGVVFFIRGETDCRFDGAYTDSNQNVYRGTINVPIAAAQLDNGTQNITITYDTPLATASGHNVATKMPNGTEIIINFENRAGNNIQSCQTRSYGWLGDSKGQVTSSTGSKSLAITVGN